jgi:SEC-C motif-containing protein
MAPSKPDFVPPKPEGPCPCGGGASFEKCCRPLLAKTRTATDAAELMRSRFTAHVARNYEHLHRTHLESSKTPYEPGGEAAPTAWTRLVIHAHETGAKPDLEFVDFTAYFTENGAERAFHEKAEFRRVEGVWYYTHAVREGPAPIRAAAGSKVGRNDPCPCGSGRKHKQCCLGKA